MEIIVDHYSKKLKGNMVLDDVSMKMSSGNIYGFMGTNGSGKTMLMRAVCGLITPTKGSVSIDGKVIGREIDFPESVGVLIEGPAFIGEMSAKENLMQLASINKKIGEKEVDEILKEVGLGNTGKKRYHRFSLGMKQRLGIACAAMEHPELVILDEPFNALDDEGVRMCASLIRKQKEDGKLVIIACHDKELIESLSDKIFKISEGKLV